MHEKAVGMITGSCVGFIGSITTDQLLEVMILSFVGGILGAMGSHVWKWFRNRYLRKKIE